MWLRLMIACFFLNGLGGVAPTMLHKAGYDAHRGMYLLLYFGMMLALALAFIYIQGKRLSVRDVAVGCPMGVLWVGTSVMCLAALAEIAPGQFWPFYTAGHVLLTCLFAGLFWKEKPNGVLGYLGIVVGAVAIVLLAYSPTPDEAKDAKRAERPIAVSVYSQGMNIR